MFQHLTSKAPRFRPLFTLTILMSWLAASLASITASASDDIGKIILSQPVELPDFKLTDHNHKSFTRASFKGKWTFAFFGYTHCPDVCPVTLTEMDKIIDVLPPQPAPNVKYQYVFITVDPARDTPAVLADYVHYFNDHIIGVTGDETEVRKLADSVKIRFSRGPGIKNEYTMNHSSAMVLIDPQGRYYARFRAPHYADRIYQLFREIRRHYESADDTTSQTQQRKG